MTDHSHSFYRAGAAPPPSASESPSVRQARLARLSPDGAIRAFLAGDFAPGEEAILCDRIRQDAGVTLTDDEMMEAFMDCFERGAQPHEAPAVLTLLREAAQFRL